MSRREKLRYKRLSAQGSGGYLGATSVANGSANGSAKSSAKGSAKGFAKGSALNDSAFKTLLHRVSLSRVLLPGQRPAGLRYCEWRIVRCLGSRRGVAAPIPRRATCRARGRGHGSVASCDTPSASASSGATLFVDLKTWLSQDVGMTRS